MQLSIFELNTAWSFYEYMPLEGWKLSIQHKLLSKSLVNKGEV